MLIRSDTIVAPVFLGVVISQKPFQTKCLWIMDFFPRTGTFYLFAFTKKTVTPVDDSDKYPV